MNLVAMVFLSLSRAVNFVICALSSCVVEIQHFIILLFRSRNLLRCSHRFIQYAHKLQISYTLTSAAIEKFVLPRECYV